MLSDAVVICALGVKYGHKNCSQTNYQIIIGNLKQTNSFYATSAGKYRHVLKSSGFSLIFGPVLFLELLSANAFTSHNLLHRKMYSKKN